MDGPERVTLCKNCGEGIHRHWTGGWIHNERGPSGGYLYCGFKAEPEDPDELEPRPPVG